MSQEFGVGAGRGNLAQVPTLLIRGHVAKLSPTKIWLGPPVVPFLSPFLGEGSPTKIDYRKKLVPLF